MPTSSKAGSIHNDMLLILITSLYPGHYNQCLLVKCPGGMSSLGIVIINFAVVLEIGCFLQNAGNSKECTGTSLVKSLSPLPQKLERGVRPSENPYPIYEQNLPCLLPYLWPVQNSFAYWWPLRLTQLPQTRITMGFCWGFINKGDKVASSKNHTQFKTTVLKPCLIYNQNAQN